MKHLKGKNSEKKKDARSIKKSLDDVVHKLDQDPDSSAKWGDSISTHKEEWEKLKLEIQKRQKALKALVMEKKAGTIGQDEFNAKYEKLQEELTQLEFQVYNLRLGTDVEV